jgi:hypothetical protein
MYLHFVMKPLAPRIVGAIGDLALLMCTYLFIVRTAGSGLRENLNMAVGLDRHVCAKQQVVERRSPEAEWTFKRSAI